MTDKTKANLIALFGIVFVIYFTIWFIDLYNREAPKFTYITTAKDVAGMPHMQRVTISSYRTSTGGQILHTQQDLSKNALPLKIKIDSISQKTFFDKRVSLLYFKEILENDTLSIQEEVNSNRRH